MTTFAHPRLQELAAFLDAQRADLRAAVDRVPPSVRERRPAPDRWSTAEVLEHLAALEGAVTGLLRTAIEDARATGAAESEVSSIRPRLDTERMRDRSRLIQAPEHVRPRGTLDADAAWEALERARATLLGTLAAGDGLALGAVSRPHPVLGALDLYQWVLAVGGHEARHADQIREIAATLRTPSRTAGLTFRELLDYTAEEAARWAAYATAHPEALALPFAAGRMATVRGAIQHIFAVERRYADRLLGDAVSAPDAIPTEPPDALFAAGRDARARLERYLGEATDEDLARQLTFETLTAGTQRASARKVVAHALVHAIRTWAQLATVVRQHGVPTDGRHDLLFTAALD